MADEPNGADAAPRIQIVNQYIRDLSFENIAAQKGLPSSDGKPDVRVQVNLDAQSRGPDRFEVGLKIKADSRVGEAQLFILELDYAGLFLMQNIPPEQMHPLLMIECPRLIFPYLRRIVGDVTRDGGYPSLNLEQIDFLALYRAELSRRQAEAPAGLPGGAWAEWRARFDRHLHQFGRTAYEFDFANPTPQEQPGPVLDAFKAFVAGAAGDPYQREREAAATREQATQAVMRRVGWPRRGWFAGLLRWAQATGPMREDSLFDMGMGHPLMRRMLAELGRRFAEGGAVAEPGAIYWLEKAEVIGLAEALERGIALPDLAGRIPARKAQWQAALRASPPVLLPENSRWARFMHGGPAKTQDGKLVLSGVGTSGGRVTAPACVLFGPDDFGKLRPGDVLVAVTTTPAWTPLFAQAAAVVTDIGGPLSHSSIVAREYGIPAVMAAGSATRAIHSGQLVTVDGTAGTVTVEG